MNFYNFNLFGVYKYKCDHCGCIFDTPAEERFHEYRGECWGTPAYEEMVYEYCPDCGSDDFYPYDEDEEEEEE